MFTWGPVSRAISAPVSPEWGFFFERTQLTLTWSTEDDSIRASITSAGAGATAANMIRTDKRYMEMSFSGDVNDQNSIGLVNFDVASPGPTDGRIGVNADEFGIRLDGVALEDGNYINTFDSWTAGDRMMIAIDPASGKGWIGKNGTWMNSGDPASGTGNIFSTLDSGGVSFGVGVDRTVAASTLFTPYLTDSDFLYAPPSGFSAWVD